MIYTKPDNLDAAVRALQENEARALAGGTDLLVRMGRVAPWARTLVDLKAIPELAVSSMDADGFHIGAGVPLSELLASRGVEAYPALQDACRLFAARQIRERATLGGNLANASPAADTVPPLIIYDAVCRTNRRVLPVESLATGPGQTVIDPDEIIVSVTIPPSASASRSFFHKLASRDAMAIAVVNVAAYLEFEERDVTLARIALGAVAPTVIRARAAEVELVGAPLTPQRIVDAADAAMAEATPIDDIRGSARYRQIMIGRLLEYHLTRILDGN